MSKFCYIVALGMSAGGVLSLFMEFDPGGMLIPIGVLVGLVGAVASLFEKDVDALRISGVTVVLVTAGLTVAVLVFADGWSKLLAIPLGLLAGLALEIVMIVSLIRRRRARAVARLVADGEPIGEGNLVMVESYAVAPLEVQAAASQVWQVLDPALARVFIDEGAQQLIIQASKETQQRVVQFLQELGVKRVSNRAVVSALKSSMQTIGMTLVGALVGGVIGYAILESSGSTSVHSTGTFFDGIAAFFIAIFVIAVICVSAFMGGALGLILGLVITASRLKKVSSQAAQIPAIPGRPGTIALGGSEPPPDPDPVPEPEPAPPSKPIPESEPPDEESPYRLDE
jgi:hypothetical protein